MSTIRLTKVYELTSGDLTVEKFSVTYTVTAHLRYTSAVNIDELTKITVIEGAGDVQDFGDTGFSSATFAAEINATLDSSTAAGKLWVDGSTNADITRTITNVGTASGNPEWDGSIADAFDTCVGSAMLNSTGSHAYTQSFVSGVHFANAASAYNTANTAAVGGSQLGDLIAADIAADAAMDPASASLFLRDVIEQTGQDSITNGTTISSLISSIQVVLKIKGSGAGGVIPITNSFNATTSDVTGIIDCEPTATPNLTIAPCVFLLEFPCTTS